MFSKQTRFLFLKYNSQIFDMIIFDFSSITDLRQIHQTKKKVEKKQTQWKIKVLKIFQVQFNIMTDNYLLYSIKVLPFCLFEYQLKSLFFNKLCEFDTRSFVAVFFLFFLSLYVFGKYIQQHDSKRYYLCQCVLQKTKKNQEWNTHYSNCIDIFKKIK